MPVFYPQARAILQVVFDGFSDDARDSEPFVFPVRPQQMSIVRNGYEQADTWDLTLNALDFPFDPQIIRAGAVDLFMFQVPSNEPGPRLLYGNQIRDRKVGERAADELNLSMRRYLRDARPSISGLFDAADLEMSEDGKTFTISGADYTDFLIKKQWKPQPNGIARRIPSGRRLDLILAEILREADEEGRLHLKVENLDPERDLSIVGNGATKANQRGIPVEQDTSYWDVMYKLATRHGCLLFVRGHDVVLTRDKNITDRYDPRIKRMVWGKNIQMCRLTRNLGKVQAPTIVIQAYDPKTRQTFEVDYPEGTYKKVKNRTATSKKGKKRTSIKKTEEFQIIPVRGITDRGVLQAAAEQRYNRLARSERDLTLVTYDLKDLDGDDLLNLQAGDAVMADFNEFNAETIINSKKTDAEKYAALRAKGFAESVADVVVRHGQKLKFLDRPLRMREASFDYDVEEGIRVEMQLQDFIVVDGRRGEDHRARSVNSPSKFGRTVSP